VWQFNDPVPNPLDPQGPPAVRVRCHRTGDVSPSLMWTAPGPQRVLGPTEEGWHVVDLIEFCWVFVGKWYRVLYGPSCWPVAAGAIDVDTSANSEARCSSSRGGSVAP
jgi:hypothetical protein